MRAWFAALGTVHTRRNSHAYALLHAIMATAVSDGLTDRNPCNLPRVMNPPRKRAPVILSIAGGVRAGRGDPTRSGCKRPGADLRVVRAALG